jgi:eukaryotic-like serine/threonine-protein kinase
MNKIDYSLEIMRQIALGLKTIHKILGAAHRDLKPENILLMNSDEKKPKLKICDFGLSKIGDMDTLSNYIGTFDYKCPRQFTP